MAISARRGHVMFSGISASRLGMVYLNACLISLFGLTFPRTGAYDRCHVIERFFFNAHHHGSTRPSPLLNTLIGHSTIAMETPQQNVNARLPCYPHQILHPYTVVSVVFPITSHVALVTRRPPELIGQGSIIDISTILLPPGLLVARIAHLLYFSDGCAIFWLSHTNSNFYYLSVPILWARFTLEEHRRMRMYLGN